MIDTERNIDSIGTGAIIDTMYDELKELLARNS